jgi:excisionase family DNA binding protein
VETGIEPERLAKGLAKTEDAQRFLNVSRAKLYGMMESGDLPYVKLGKSRRIRWEDLEDLIARNRVSR